jgi:hypothetical protein
VQGINDVLGVWREWAAAFPDSKATFNTVATSGKTVIMEVTSPRRAARKPTRSCRGSRDPDARRLRRPERVTRAL